MAILSTTLTSTPQAISPSLSNDLAITVIFLCNLNFIDPLDPTAGRQFVDVYVVPNGSDPLPINKIGNQIPIDAGDTFSFNTERLVLSPGDRVFASTSDAGLTSATISYVII
jgi:hypothetical protein